MSPINIKTLSVADLLTLHVQIGEELRKRGVVRSANNPTGDLAETLFCKAFGWTQAPNSAKGYDATGDDGTRYQIKARRIHVRNPSRQLSAIRNLNDKPFDVLAGVLFDESFRVTKGAIIPFEIIKDESTYRKHTNSHLFHLRDTVWNLPGVRDVTDELKRAEAQISTVTP